MSETYAQAIKAARERYREAMDGAAGDVVLIVDEHGKPMATVCKDIAGDEWNALRRRAQRLVKTAGQTPDERARRVKSERARKNRAAAKVALTNPEQRKEVLRSLPEETKMDLRLTLLLESAEAAPRVEMPEFDPWLQAQEQMVIIDRHTEVLAGRIQKSRMEEHRQAALDEWVDGHVSEAQQLRTDQGRAALRVVREA